MTTAMTRLERAQQAEARCRTKATHATVRASLAHTEQARADWQAIADEARAVADEWRQEARRLTPTDGLLAEFMDDGWGADPLGDAHLDY